MTETDTVVVIPAESYMCGSGKVTIPEHEVGKKFTCRIAIVNPGFSDSVIKVHPAEHSAETVLMDRNPGVDRWGDIKRLMDEYGPRNKKIPVPVPLHSSPQDSIVPSVKEDELPVVELSDGQYLKAPPKVFMTPEPRPVTVTTSTTAAPPVVAGDTARVESLEKKVEALTGLLSTLNDTIKGMAQGEKRGPGRPRKE